MGNPGSIPGSGRSPGEGNGYPSSSKYSCLENSMDRRPYWVILHVMKKPPANAGDIRNADSVLGSGRSFGGRRGNPL